MPQDERVSKFIAAITKEAEEKRSVIEQETRAFVETEMNKAELEALNESYSMIQRAGASIRSDAGSRISAGKLESRRQLLLRREEIVGELLDAVSARLKKYTATQEYTALLEHSAAKAADVFQGLFIVFLRPEDMHLADVVKKAAGDRCTVMEDTSIQLGGLRFSDPEGFRLADDTLDARLKDGREWFMKHSGLTVGRAAGKE